jgi:hypothetical protein
MPTVEPSGWISEPLERLRDLIADCTAFQTWVGAADAAAAKLHIHYHGYTGNTRPFVVIGDMPGYRIGLRDTHGTPRLSGNLWLAAEAAVGADYLRTDDDAGLEFGNAWGAVLAEMVAKAGTGASYNMELASLERVDGPNRSSDEERAQGEDFIQEIWQVTWGFDR